MPFKRGGECFCYPAWYDCYGKQNVGARHVENKEVYCSAQVLLPVTNYRDERVSNEAENEYSSICQTLAKLSLVIQMKRVRVAFLVR